MRVFCVATGTSLTKQDVDYIQGKGVVYAVKEARIYAPWADVLYAADHFWWDLNKGCPDFAGKKYSVTPSGCYKRFPEIEYLEYNSSLLWSKEKGVLATGGNSGFQAMNLAYLNGATEIILLGYDMGYSGSKVHFWDGMINRQFGASDYNRWLKHIHLAKDLIDIPVINCTRGGYLNAFKRANLEDVC